MSAEYGQRQQPGGRGGRSSGNKKSKKRCRRKESYSMYIYKVLKQVSAEQGCVWGMPLQSALKGNWLEAGTLRLVLALGQVAQAGWAPLEVAGPDFQGLYLSGSSAPVIGDSVLPDTLQKFTGMMMR